MSQTKLLLNNILIIIILLLISSCGSSKHHGNELKKYSLLNDVLTDYDDYTLLLDPVENKMTDKYLSSDFLFKHDHYGFMDKSWKNFNFEEINNCFKPQLDSLKSNGFNSSFKWKKKLIKNVNVSKQQNNKSINFSYIQTSEPVFIRCSNYALLFVLKADFVYGRFDSGDYECVLYEYKNNKWIFFGRIPLLIMD